MKILTLLILLSSLTVLGQIIDPRAMGSSVGALNQVTKETDEGSITNSQDQEEKLYREEQQRQNQEWEESKAQDQFRIKELEKSKKWKSQ